MGSEYRNMENTFNCQKSFRLIRELCGKNAIPNNMKRFFELDSLSRQLQEAFSSTIWVAMINMVVICLILFTICVRPDITQDARVNCVHLALVEAVFVFYCLFSLASSIHNINKELKRIAEEDPVEMAVKEAMRFYRATLADNNTITRNENRGFWGTYAGPIMFSFFVLLLKSYVFYELAEK